jgi:hypothetical protein
MLLRSASYECGEVLLPLADGGQGVPGVGLIPELFELPVFAVLLPEVEGELDEPLVDPAVELFAEPGNVPHGPLDDFPELFGFAEGEALPGVVVDPGVVEDPGVVDPGVVVFGVPLGDVEPGVVGFWGVVCGVAVPAGGVAVLAGGVAVPAGGVAAPGVELCPAVPEPPAGAVPPAGALCATTQLVQHKTTDSNVSFVIDISSSPGVRFGPETKYEEFKMHKISGLCLISGQ